ncbi:MAG: sigma-70 family RNA polymerase sigma factor [Phycisphaerae bacterium]
MASGKRKLRPAGSAKKEPATSRRDENLIRGVLAGDADALRALIDQYDRLIRYTIFRACNDECRKDPTFLDARASEVWSGLVETVRRRGIEFPASLKPYLVQIARNKCHDYLRRAAREAATHPQEQPAASGNAEPVDPAANPLTLLIELEQVQAVRDCIEQLAPNDRNLLQQIDLIAESRWAEAARRLNLPESTLRSRWVRMVDQVRRRVEKNLGKDQESFAPKGECGDS